MSMRRRLTALALLGISVYLVVGLGRQVWSTIQSSRRIDQAPFQLEREKQRNQQLQKEISYLESDDFVEKEARDKLGMARRGETVVIVAKDLAEQASSRLLEREALPNWYRWWQLFSRGE